MPEPHELFQLPANSGYLPYSEIETLYPKLVKAITKRGISYYYDYNPVLVQYMCKESVELQIMKLMDMDINTATLGNDPDSEAAAATLAKMKKAGAKVNVYFTDVRRISPGSIFKDVPDIGETTTIEQLIETYPDTAASFDGKDMDSRLDYFFKRHVKRSDEGSAIYIPINKERRQMFWDILEDEIEERLSKNLIPESTT
jgi:hypothetical protein